VALAATFMLILLILLLLSAANAEIKIKIKTKIKIKRTGVLVAFAAEAELVSGADGLAVLEVDFQQFLALDVGAFFVFQAGDDFAAGGVDDVAG